MNLASEFGGRAIHFDELPSALAEADIVVSSTGCPHTILNREDLAAIMPARRNRPLFLVDIAVPRDIDADVQELPNVFLYNVDHLESIVRENVRMREQELATLQANHRRTRCDAHDPIDARARPAAALPDNSRSSDWALAGLAACHG